MTFEDMLTGGHPNSLGRTLEVVDTVLAAPARMAELYNTYQSKNAVVRLRVSNAIRRVEAQNHDLLIPYLDRFIEEIGALDQASAQWTLAVLFDLYDADMSADQKARAQALLQRNLAEHTDWIVLNNTMETLGKWASDDANLRTWLEPQLTRLAEDPRKSVASRAARKLALLQKGKPMPSSNRQIGRANSA